MDEVFTSTHWNDATRNMVINNERILYIERTEGEKVAYTVTFDNGQVLELDEGTGKVLADQLEELRRPSPPAYHTCQQERSFPPKLPRRWRGGIPS